MISDWLPFKDKHITNISRDMARAIFWIYIINALILLHKVFEKNWNIFEKNWNMMLLVC